MTTRTYANLVREKVSGITEHYIALTSFNSSVEPRKERLWIPEKDYVELRNGFEDAIQGKESAIVVKNFSYEEPVARGEILDKVGPLEVTLETQ